MRVYDEVLRDHVALVSAAADFAARRHSGQMRKGAAAEPYINHLAEVASLLATTLEEPDAGLVAAGWLHDTIEDTGVAASELVERFGEAVAAIVVEVTDDKSLPKAERKRLQVENARHKSVSAKQLKLADKTSNLRAIAESPPDAWTIERCLAYVDWSEQVCASCRGTNPELEALFDEASAAARHAIATRADQLKAS